MTQLPLLLFPAPEDANRGSAGGGGSGKLSLPGAARQGDRLAPMLAELQHAFELRNVEMQSTSEGIDPEQVLVLETVGTVEDFFKAVRHIDGFDWLGEIDIEDIVPDADFHDAEKADKPLDGRVYLMMTNQQALAQMLSLWERYQRDTSMNFRKAPYLGLAKFKDVFLRLKAVRRWGIRDRLMDTGLLDAWREDLEHFPSDRMKVEIELWFRSSPAKRQEAESSIRRLLATLDGSVIRSCIIAEIAYHAVLAELPRAAIEAIIVNQEIELIRCENVMFFRPVGQIVAQRYPVDEPLHQQPPIGTERPASGEPIVAVLDGMPLANHVQLLDRLRIDDPDDFASTYSIEWMQHGTAMCSLIVRGDISRSEAPHPRPVYVRPIMRPRPIQNGRQIEELPSDELVIDLIHRAVRRLFERDGQNLPVAPSVKIINLSIGDPFRPYFHFISPLAKLLDWLSYKYSVLFIVSAGNHPGNIEPGVTLSEFQNLPANQREERIVKRLFEDAKNRRLISPAESINALFNRNCSTDEDYKCTGTDPNDTGE